MPIDLAHSYDQYFTSHLYDQRYPHPNPAGLALIIEQMRSHGHQVLDFGCGNGRYSAALLAGTPAHLLAYDISAQALHELTERQAPHLASGRLQPVLGDLHALRHAAAGRARFDVALLMFGVLGHIFPQAQRLETLRTIRELVRPGGRLIVTVPNVARRFHREQAIAQQERGLEAGDILYQRHAAATDIDMYYHLYTVDEFHRELTVAGWRVLRMRAESILPESLVVKSTALSYLDHGLQRLLPLRYAYGFLALAET